MYRVTHAENDFSQRASVSTSAGLQVRSDTTAGSWISMLTAVSRPAWVLLRKYLPGKLQILSSEAEKPSVDFEHKLMVGPGNVIPGDQSPTHLHMAYVHYQQENCEGFSSDGVETLSWLTADLLREFRIQENMCINLKVEQTTQMEYRYLTTTRKFLSRFLAPKEGNQSMLVGYPTVKAINTWWWQGLWISDPPQNTVYETKTSADAETQSAHCKGHHSTGHCEVDCQRSANKQVKLLGQNNQVKWTCRECAGLSHYKELADQTTKLEFPLNSNCSVHEHTTVEHIDNKAAAACSEMAGLTLDKDNGYSSLEEESSGAGQCNMNTVCELLDLGSSSASSAGDHGHGGERDKSEGNTQCEKVENKEEYKEDEGVQNAELAIVQEALVVQSTPLCLNKAIAYIIGSPCSDESDTEDSLTDGDEDDGFDSDDLGSCSDSVDSDDEEEDDEDSESDDPDSETERLWSSLCQTRDPYNPRNFTAPIRTSKKLSESVVNSCTVGSPVEQESLVCSPPSLFSSSPEAPQKDIESSEEACSSMDEAESHRLWDLFSCSSDPYSPLNFRAAIRTQQPGRRCLKKEPTVEHLIYRKEEADERMDSGFSEAAIGPGVVRLKKVTFMEEVEEFYASSDEERHGPWEEYARDRCRFQRRVQEVEKSISYCLSPNFRLKVFQRHYSSS